MDVWTREALGLIPWLAGSWFLSTTTLLLLWLAQGWGRPGQAVLRFLRGEAWVVSPGEVVAFLYALGLPYAALVSGFLDPAALGLAGFSWWQTLGRAALLGGGLVLLAWMAWRTYLRVAARPPGLLARSQRLTRAPADWPLLLLWAAAEEVHWAFYRALPMLLWGPGIGLWIGVLLVVAERYGGPQTTARLRQPGGVEEEAWWSTRLVAMTAAYAVLRNLWLCVVLHALVEGVVAWTVRRHAAHAGRRPRAASGSARATAPAVVCAAAGALVLLTLFTWQAARPQLIATGPAAAVQPTLLVIPTTTPTATPFPTPPATATPTATPLPTATPVPPTPTPPRTYVVQRGDTLNAIAAMFGVSVADLMRVNDITDPTKLSIGQVLIIP